MVNIRGGCSLTYRENNFLPPDIVGGPEDCFALEKNDSNFGSGHHKLERDNNRLELVVLGLETGGDRERSCSREGFKLRGLFRVPAGLRENILGECSSKKDGFLSI